MFMPAAALLPLVLATLPVPVPIHALEAQEHQTMPSVLERKVFELRDGDMARPASERFDRTIAFIILIGQTTTITYPGSI